LNALSQNIDLANKEPILPKLSISTGSLKTDYIVNNRPIQALVFSPKLEIGGNVNLHIGGNIFVTDSGSYDSVKRTQGNLEIGLSAEKHLTNQPFYIKGGYLLRPSDSKGHRLFAQFGIEFIELVDFHIIASRFYDRKDILSGNILEFGVRLKLK